MKYYADLHIHSALSPCGSDDMTPNNIVNMAMLKQLDFIAVTDHNHYLNAISTYKVAMDKDIIVVPGIEVCTSEDIHVVCLFENIAKLKEFSEKVINSMPYIKNKTELFGNQFVMNENDMVIDEIDNLLVVGCAYSINEINDMVLDLDGIFIPAHIYRQSTGIVSILGTIPEELKYKYVEAKINVENCPYKYIKTSDAHQLEAILEKEQCFELKDKSISCLFDKLKYTKNV